MYDMEVPTYAERMSWNAVTISDIHEKYPEALVVFDSQLPEMAGSDAVYFLWPRNREPTATVTVRAWCLKTGIKAAWHDAYGVWVRLSVGFSCKVTQEEYASLRREYKRQREQELK